MGRTIPAATCEVQRVDQSVVLVLGVPCDDPAIAAVMTPREARRVAHGLGKAANDAGAAKARATETST